jgi:hypothetical protein
VRVSFRVEVVTTSETLPAGSVLGGVILATAGRWPESRPEIVARMTGADAVARLDGLGRPPKRAPRRRTLTALPHETRYRRRMSRGSSEPARLPSQSGSQQAALGTAITRKPRSRMAAFLGKAAIRLAVGPSRVSHFKPFANFASGSGKRSPPGQRLGGFALSGLVSEGFARRRASRRPGPLSSGERRGRDDDSLEGARDGVRALFSVPRGERSREPVNSEAGTVTRGSTVHRRPPGRDR